MAQKKDSRGKNWVAVMYPESLPSDWKSLLRDMMTDIIISPLHDRDIQPDGTKKKPHYHVVFKFSSNKTFEQVKTLLEPFNCPIPQKVTSIKGQIRYLIHIDDPDKFQYEQSDIEIIGNVDISPYFQISQMDKYEMIGDMMDFIDDNGITEFSHLMQYARVHRRGDWFPLLVDSSTYVIDKYISSTRNKMRQDKMDRMEAISVRNTVRSASDKEPLIEQEEE